MIIRNVIRQARGEKPQRSRAYEAITHVVVHRIGEKIGKHGAEVSERFRADPKVGSYTGMQVPYHFVVCASGIADQCLELEEVGAHALRKWNDVSIAVAFIGDFRKHPVPTDQWFGGSGVVAALAAWVGEDCIVCGHTELPGASKDASKVCPGQFFLMDQLRAEVKASAKPGLSPLEREMHLRRNGVVF